MTAPLPRTSVVLRPSHESGALAEPGRLCITGMMRRRRVRRLGLRGCHRLGRPGPGPGPGDGPGESLRDPCPSACRRTPSPDDSDNRRRELGDTVTQAGRPQSESVPVHWTRLLPPQPGAATVTCPAPAASPAVTVPDSARATDSGPLPRARLPAAPAAARRTSRRVTNRLGDRHVTMTRDWAARRRTVHGPAGGPGVMIM